MRPNGTVRLTLHDYATDPYLRQKDGVNLAHENIASLCRQDHAGVDIVFHDFNRLLSDADYAVEILSNTDVVVANVGPHAHYYFYLRAQHGLDFAIIRDVRTAVWSGYLLQEHLCQPYLRASDTLLVASVYTRAVCHRLFPHLRHHALVQAYPLTVGFPASQARRPSPDRSQPLVLGYIGRLSEDKNFHDIVELLIRLNEHADRTYMLLACGDVHSGSCDPAVISRKIAAHLGQGEYFRYLPTRSNGEIWALYEQMDVLLFPSTSNLETLGRVLVEASHAGVPVVCGRHAAAVELVPEAQLSPVTYFTGQTFDCHGDHPLGTIAVEDMAEVIMKVPLRSGSCHEEARFRPPRFMQVVTRDVDGLSKDSLNLLHPSQQQFVDSLEVDLPHPLSLVQADAAIRKMLPRFLGLQSQDRSVREDHWAELLVLSRRPDRTRRFIEAARHSRGDFTNVGGIDMELCHIVGFYPSFHLAPDAVRCKVCASPWVNARAVRPRPVV